MCCYQSVPVSLGEVERSPCEVQRSVLSFCGGLERVKHLLTLSCLATCYCTTVGRHPEDRMSVTIEMRNG